MNAIIGSPTGSPKQKDANKPFIFDDMKEANDKLNDSKDDFTNDVSTKEKTHEKSGELPSDENQIKTT